MDAELAREIAATWELQNGPAGEDAIRVMLADLSGYPPHKVRLALTQRRQVGGRWTLGSLVEDIRQIRDPEKRVDIGHRLDAPETSGMPSHVRKQLYDFTNGSRYDYRAWAKRILANPGAYPNISVAMAREVAGIAPEPVRDVRGVGAAGTQRVGGVPRGDPEADAPGRGLPVPPEPLAADRLEAQFDAEREGW